MRKDLYNSQLREKVRITKALNPEYTYKEFAEMLQITYPSFRNWLSGSYDFSLQRARMLDGILSDLL